MPKILFLHIGWAREYRGAANDPPIGTFGYIRNGNSDPGEAVNFRPYQGRMYGYAPSHTLHLARLGAAQGATCLDGVLVIWTATEPGGSGRYIVGWYRNARVHCELVNRRPDPGRPGIIAEAAVGDCHLVAADDRMFWIPRMKEGWPGVYSAFYASDTLTKENQQRVLTYVAGEPSTGFFSDFHHNIRGSIHGQGGNGHRRSSTDAAKNALVEQAAVAAVVKHYEAEGWAWQTVEHENKGWDIEFVRGGHKLLVEVKGRDAEGAVEMTPNEYTAMCGRDTRMSYRLAIVWNARSDDPKLTIFEYQPASQTWIAENGTTLRIQKKIGAIISRLPSARALRRRPIPRPSLKTSRSK